MELDSKEWKYRYQVTTRDEIQVLYEAICRSEQSISQKVTNIRENECELSETDLMTGIRNRGSGENEIGRMIECRKAGMMCVLDCDKFKQINDTYGHIVGDKVLIAIASKMQEICRKDDVVLRLGGDEFAMFIPEIRTEKEAEDFFENLFGCINEIYIRELKGHKLTVSLGAVFFCENSRETFDSLYRKADQMLYESKKVHGFCARIYKEER